MKIIAVNGSPRKNGNTETVLAAFLAGAAEAGAETKSVRLSDLTFRNCKGCNACHKKGICVIADSLTPVFEELMQADMLVLASPIYSMTVTAEMKAFIDRGQFLWAQKFKTQTLVFSEEHLQTHTGVFLATSGQNVDGIFNAAFPVVKAFFNDSGFVYRENILYPGMDTRGGVKNWPESTQDAYARGKALAAAFIAQGRS